MVTLLREPARPAAIREHPLAPWFAVATVCFGAFMGQLDASIVTVAFPALQRQFGTGLAAVQWVSLAYLLVLTALLVPAGRWSDRAGRKLMYLYGFLVFAGASAACGLATTLGMLIALRVVQAVGAAMLQANSVAIVVTSVPSRTRRAALGVQAAAQAVGLAVGPVAGGLLVAAAGWRLVFFLNVPVGAIALIAGWYLLPRTRRAVSPGSTMPGGAMPGGAIPGGAMPGGAIPGGAIPGGAIPGGAIPGGAIPGGAIPGADGAIPEGAAALADADVRGMGLLALSVSAGLLALSSLSGLGMPAWGIAAFAAAAVAAGVLLVRHEHGYPAPLLDLRAMKASGTGPALIGALASYLVLFGPLVLFPQVVTAKGGSAITAGLLLTTLPAGFGLAAATADHLLPEGWSNGHRCLAGGALAAVCAAALAVPAPHAVSVILLGLLGVGLGIYTPANNAEIMAAVPARDAAAAGGMVNMTRGIGTALGVVIVALGLHAGPLLPWPGGGQILSMAALAAVALVATWAGRRGRQGNRAQDAGGSQ